MKANKFIDELIEFEQNYQSGYTSVGENIPVDSKMRLRDLKDAKKELIDDSNQIKDYLKEVTKRDIIKKLEDINYYISMLMKITDKSKIIDIKAKQNIIYLEKLTRDIYNKEMNRRINKLRKSGKLIQISNDKIDQMVENAKKEFGV